MRRVSTKFKLLESIPVDSTTLLESFCVTCAPSSSSNMRKLTYPITPAKLHLVQKMFPSLGLNLSVRRPFRSINIRGIWIQICAKLTEFEVSIYKYACHASGFQYFNGCCRAGPGALIFESFSWESPIIQCSWHIGQGFRKKSRRYHIGIAQNGSQPHAIYIS
jgi:hypothetical protein